MSQAPITVTGNITHDPELVFTGQSTAKLAFSIAVNHYWNDTSGERQERTSFFNAVAWKLLAEDAANVLQKGMRVVVTGRLEQRTYQDKEGKDRQTVEIVVEDIGASVRGLASVERKAPSSNGQKQAPAAKGAQNRPAPARQAAARQASVLVEDEEPF